MTMTPKQQAESLHKKVTAFIITCVGADGYPMTKAVVPGKHRESLNELFFTTNTSSNFAAAIETSGKSSVYFFHQGLTSWKGCLLKGDMEIVTDMSIKEKYWQEKFKDAYPQKSFTDPDFCVIRFVPTQGRFYADFTIEDFEM